MAQIVTVLCAMLITTATNANAAMPYANLAVTSLCYC